MNKLFAIFVFALLCTAAFAQTYDQSNATNIRIPGQWGCRNNTYVCQDVPMTSGDTWTLTDGNGSLGPGYQFEWDLTPGVVEKVLEQPVNFGDGPFEFTFSLSDGRTGTVSGTFVLHLVFRGKYAAVEDSTVTIQ